MLVALVSLKKILLFKYFLIVPFPDFSETFFRKRGTLEPHYTTSLTLNLLKSSWTATYIWENDTSKTEPDFPNSSQDYCGKAEPWTLSPHGLSHPAYQRGSWSKYCGVSRSSCVPLFPSMAFYTEGSDLAIGGNWDTLWIKIGASLLKIVCISSSSWQILKGCGLLVAETAKIFSAAQMKIANETLQ